MSNGNRMAICCDSLSARMALLQASGSRFSGGCLDGALWRPLYFISYPVPRLLGRGMATLARLFQGIAARLRCGQSVGGPLNVLDVSAVESSAIDHFLGRRPSS